MPFEEQVIGACRLIFSDASAVLPTLEAGSVDAIVTDPPYHLTTGKPGDRGMPSLNEHSPAGRSRVDTGFMGKAWDGGDIAHNPAFWTHALRLLKPGGHLVAFGGTRTHHRLMCALENAGFEIRDTLMWVYSSGFPKSLSVSKAIDKTAHAEREVIGTLQTNIDMQGNNYANGSKTGAVYITAPATDAARQYEGYGTNLKPAWEPIVLCRKPLVGTVAENVLRYGTGALNIDACRIMGDMTSAHFGGLQSKSSPTYGQIRGKGYQTQQHAAGRWPANVIHDDSDEVRAFFPSSAGQLVDISSNVKTRKTNVYGMMKRGYQEASADRTYENRGGTDFAMKPGARRLDTGSAARFFYAAKVSRSERGENNTHPTLKPLSLMCWLVRLVTPSGGLVLDPFLGSGTTALACKEEGMHCIGIEREPEYYAIACRRIEEAYRQGDLFTILAAVSPAPQQEELFP